MQNFWLNLDSPSVIIGAIIALIGSFLVEFFKEYLKRKKQKRKNKNILKGLEEEIREGIFRCEAIIKMARNQKFSFSHIYVEFWESVKIELAQNFEDVKILNLLHRIYYRFDLINFNMDKERLGAGVGFAKKYIDEIKENFNKVYKK